MSFHQYQLSVAAVTRHYTVTSLMQLRLTLFKNIFMGMSSFCLGVCVPYASPGPLEVIRGHEISWNWS